MNIKGRKTIYEIELSDMEISTLISALIQRRDSLKDLPDTELNANALSETDKFLYQFQSALRVKW